MTDVPAVPHWDGPRLDAWKPWDPSEVARRLGVVDIPWCVVGGWAIDLFVRHQTREHGDLEIAILRPDLPRVRRALHGFVFHAVGNGEVWRLDDDAEPPPELHQNWVLDPAADAWRVDVMLENGDADTWMTRRNPGLRVPRTFMVGRTDDGIPFLGPHGVLLYKAKYLRPKDEADFSVCLPLMDDTVRTWLAIALEAVHPGHPWQIRLVAGQDT